MNDEAETVKKYYIYKEIVELKEYLLGEAEYISSVVDGLLPILDSNELFKYVVDDIQKLIQKLRDSIDDLKEVVNMSEKDAIALYDENPLRYDEFIRKVSKE